MAEIRITCGVHSFRAGWISKGAGPDSAVHGVPDSGDRTGDLDESVCNGCAERTTLPQYVEKKCLETFENNEFLSGENQDVQKKWLESMGVPEELVNQILGSGAVREYQEEQLHSLASYAAKAVSEKIMKGIAFFLTLVLAVGFVTIAVKIVELIAEIPGISFLNRMGGAGLGVVRAVLWIWIFFAVVYCFQATHWGNVCMKQIQGDMALAWIRENNPVLMLLKNVL